MNRNRRVDGTAAAVNDRGVGKSQMDQTGREKVERILVGHVHSGAGKRAKDFQIFGSRLRRKARGETVCAPLQRRLQTLSPEGEFAGAGDFRVTGEDLF